MLCTVEIHNLTAGFHQCGRMQCALSSDEQALMVPFRSFVLSTVGRMSNMHSSAFLFFPAGCWILGRSQADIEFVHFRIRAPTSRHVTSSPLMPARQDAMGKKFVWTAPVFRSICFGYNLPGLLHLVKCDCKSSKGCGPYKYSHEAVEITSVKQDFTLHSSILALIASSALPKDNGVVNNEKKKTLSSSNGGRHRSHYLP